MDLDQQTDELNANKVSNKIEVEITTKEEEELDSLHSLLFIIVMPYAAYGLQEIFILFYKLILFGPVQAADQAALLLVGDFSSYHIVYVFSKALDLVIAVTGSASLVLFIKRKKLFPKFFAMNFVYSIGCLAVYFHGEYYENQICTPSCYPNPPAPNGFDSIDYITIVICLLISITIPLFVLLSDKSKRLFIN